MFDTDDPLLFAPVPVRPQANGWSPEVQRAFIDALSTMGVVAAAARSVGRTARSAHLLRVRAGPGSGFARAWAAALSQAGAMAIDRAVALGEGKVREPVFHRGRQVGWRDRHDNRVLFAALRALDGLHDARERAGFAQGSNPPAQRDCATAVKTGKTRAGRDRA